MSRQLPTLKPREVIRGLERAGFLLLRARGPALLVCVPVHPGDLKRSVLRSILRQADLTVDAFLDLL